MSGQYIIDDTWVIGDVVEIVAALPVKLSTFYGEIGAADAEWVTLRCSRNHDGSIGHTFQLMVKDIKALTILKRATGEPAL